MQVLQKPASAEEAASALVAWVHQHFTATDSGIVYCLTRKAAPWPSHAATARPCYA